MIVPAAQQKGTGAGKGLIYRVPAALMKTSCGPFSFDWTKSVKMYILLP